MRASEWSRFAACWLVVAGGLCLTGGCATGDPGEGEAEPKTRSKLVGRVASMPKGQDFVLLQSYGAWTVPPGAPVFCSGPDGRLANLLPTGEKMGQFVAADLRDGEVQVGDAVYYRVDGRVEAPKPAAGDEGVSDGAEQGPPAPPKPAPEGSGEPDLPR